MGQRTALIYKTQQITLWTHFKKEKLSLLVPLEGSQTEQQKKSAINKAKLLGQDWLIEWIYKQIYIIKWNTVLLEKLDVLQLVMKLPQFYGTWRVITTFTRACHLSLILIQINLVHALPLCSLKDNSLIFKECLSPNFHCADERIP